MPNQQTKVHALLQKVTTLFDGTAVYPGLDERVARRTKITCCAMNLCINGQEMLELQQLSSPAVCKAETMKNVDIFSRGTYTVTLCSSMKKDHTYSQSRDGVTLIFLKNRL